jgi:hypothetical protein
MATKPKASASAGSPRRPSPRRRAPYGEDAGDQPGQGDEPQRPEPADGSVPRVAVYAGGLSALDPAGHLRRGVPLDVVRPAVHEPPADARVGTELDPAAGEPHVAGNGRVDHHVAACGIDVAVDRAADLDAAARGGQVAADAALARDLDVTPGQVRAPRNRAIDAHVAATGVEVAAHRIAHTDVPAGQHRVAADACREVERSGHPEKVAPHRRGLAHRASGHEAIVGEVGADTVLGQCRREVGGQHESGQQHA